MTCVISPTWQPFNPSSYGWSPMNPADSISSPTGLEHPHHGYVSSESETKQASSGSSTRKRPSRAGTRSVTTLSAAQLERKRANDREAQRAIRQRTKDHIEHLERNITELRSMQDSNEKVVVATQRRNQELEEENAYLRSKLGEAGYPVNLPPHEDHRSADQNLLAVHSTSPAMQAGTSVVPHSESTSSPRSALSLTTTQSSASRHGSWQQAQSNLVPNSSSGLPSLAGPGPVPLGPNLTTWRSHESTHSVHSASGQLQDPSQAQAQTPYSATNPNERMPWPAPSQSYVYQEQQRPQHFEQSPQPQQQYAPQPVANYGPTATTPAPSAYHQQPPPPPQQQHPPQSEFQGMSVSSPTAYQVPQQQTFSQQTQYQISPMQVSAPTNNPNYASHQPVQMAPQLPPTASYHPGAPGEQQYPPQPQIHPPMAFRDDASARAYSLTHYPSG